MRLLGEPRNAKVILASGQICLSIPGTHVRFLNNPGQTDFGLNLHFKKAFLGRRFILLFSHFSTDKIWDENDEKGPKSEKCE